MHTPIIYRLLSTFSKQENRKFLKFLTSDYCSKSPRMVLLFKHIRKYIWNLEHKKLGKKEVFKCMETKQEFSAKFINDRFNELHELVLNFLAFEEVKSNPEQKSNLLRKSYEKRHLFNFLKKESKKEIERLEKGNLNDWKTLLRVWEIKETIYKHPLFQKYNPSENNVVTTMPYLDTFFVHYKMRYGLQQLLIKLNFKNENKEIFLLDEVIKQYKGSENIVFDLYKMLLQIPESEDIPAAWANVLEEYKNAFDSLPFEEKNGFLTALINYKNKIARGYEENIFKTLLTLFRFGLDHQLWTKFGYISNQVFKNIVVCSVSIGEFNWTESFIAKYLDFLEDGSESGTLLYARAYIFFHKEEYKETYNTITKFNELEGKMELYENLSYRSLYIRSVYEMEKNTDIENGVLEHSLNNFQQFIQDKLSDESRIPYLNLIYFIRRLNEPTPNSEIRKKLRKKLEREYEKRTKPVSFRWVEQKIKEL